MPLAAIFVAASLSVAHLSLTPVADDHTAADLAAPMGLWAPARPVCGRQFDPQFVRFVPPAPASGRNPLLRLIAGPGEAVRLHDLPGSCKRMLTRDDKLP